MKMKRDVIVDLIAAVCALLFFYAAGSKLINYDQSRHEMLKQIFPRNIGGVLVWLVPATELVIAGLLLYKPLRLKGLNAFAGLMAAFTVYIAIAMSGVFGKIPCSCGGILRHMSYWTHLGFNLFFVGAAIVGIKLHSVIKRSLLQSR